MLVSITACNASGGESDTSLNDSPSVSQVEPSQEKDPQQLEQNILIAYLSHTGKTRTVAEHIRDLTGGDLFEIRTVDPYPNDYNAHVAQASEELAADFRPALSTHVSGMENYDVVYIGFPIWHSNTPMPIRTFLEEYDFSDKTVIPFCTSGSSGIDQSVTAIRELLPDSDVLDGLVITNSTFERAYELTEQWIAGLIIEG